MAVAPDGTVYFTGQLGANYSGGTVVGKVLSDRALAFSTFTSPFVAPHALAYRPVSGGALITGTVNWSPPAGGIFAVDANGSFRWGSFANGTAVPYDAAIDGNGTAFIVTTLLLNGRLDAGFVAFDESGTLFHERRLDLPNDEYGWSVTLGPDGDPYYLGFSYQNYDPISARFTPDLVPQWTEYVGSPTLYDYGWRIVSPRDATGFGQGNYYAYQNGESGSVTYPGYSAGALADPCLLPRQRAGR